MTQYDLEHANLYADGPTATAYRGRNAEAALYPPADVAAAGDDTAETVKTPQNYVQSQK